MAHLDPNYLRMSARHWRAQAAHLRALSRKADAHAHALEAEAIHQEQGQMTLEPGSS